MRAFPVAAVMVCTLGQTSRHYTGGCGPALAGAYLGALAALPLALLGGAAGHTDFHDDEGNTNFSSGSAIGFAIGYALGAAIGATIAWHRAKEKRDVVLPRLAASPPPARADAVPWAELTGRAGAGARASRGNMMQLLAFTF